MKIKLADVIEDIAAGPFGSNLKVESFVSKGFPIIDGANLKGVKVTDDITKFVTNEKAYSLKRSIAGRGDVIVTISGTLGQIAYIPDDSLYGEYLVSQRQFRVTFDKNKVDPRFIVYYFHTTHGQKQILAFANYVGVPALSQPLDNFRKIEVDLPSLEAQQAIANALSVVEAKIDNNNAIATELEDMAKDLYDYWFVQFDFPDENGKPYKSSGGKMVWNDELKREIPEGWENGIVSDLGTVVTGGTPSTGCAEYFAKSKSGHAWATPKDLSNLNGRYFYHGEADITDAGLKNSAGNIMPKGSVLFTTRAPIGYIAITANEACTNQGFKSIIPAKKFGTEFVFQTLKMLTPQMQRVGVGSTFKEVSKDVFSHQSIVIPSVNLLKKYAALTLDIAEKIRNTQEENVELTSLRDFLLPMLMNGQVKVKGA